MKKLKPLPTILMLVLCVGVLAVGVFAITPTKNTISGTITVTSSNPEVEISLTRVTKNAEGTVVETPITTTPYTVRAGVDLDFGALNFATGTANLVGDVPDISVRLDVTNKSNQDLGMYFATSASVNAGTAKTESIDVVTGVLEAQFSDYTKLPKTQGQTAGTASSTLTFHLKAFPSTDVNLQLNTLTLYFNIEPYNSDLVATVIEADSGTIISADKYKENTTLKKVEIASGVTEIGANAFKDCTSLTSVVIPASVKTINADAFNGCTNLKTIVLNEGLETISNRAFANCKSLEEITIPSTVTSLGTILYFASENGFYIDIFEGCIDSTADNVISGSGQPPFVGNVAYNGKLKSIKLKEGTNLNIEYSYGSFDDKLHFSVYCGWLNGDYEADVGCYDVQYICYMGTFTNTIEADMEFTTYSYKEYMY